MLFELLTQVSVVLWKLVIVWFWGFMEEKQVW